MAEILTELKKRGYAVVPTPRQIEFSGADVVLAKGLRVEAGSLSADIATRTLTAAISGLGLTSTPDALRVELEVSADAVRTGLSDKRHQHAYRLVIDSRSVKVTGNALPGLLYGVQTLIQLLDSQQHFPLRLPACAITDWPQYEMRTIHWDTKHHQDRVETLQRYLDEMARFKLNTVSFELEDKFAYPTHPLIGAPDAFTAEQMKSLVRYGLERHIQIIPNVQAPAHLCYVLKHEQYAHLRCDGSNYQSCMEDPAVLKLIFEMYGDLCDATPGVECFHVSTDEVYYAGICERYRKPYNPENRSLTFVEFVNRAHEFLRSRGRRMIVWAEFPLLAKHVEMLPEGIIDGIVGGGEDFLQAELKRGIRQLAYSPIQGAELLFPNYFSYPNKRGVVVQGRLDDAFKALERGKATRGNPIGTFAASWDDSGHHNEIFWLGWAVMAQASWTTGATTVPQTVADFGDVFYGPRSSHVAVMYQLLQRGARFFEHTWESVPSRVRPPGYGYSKGKRPTGRQDLTLQPPALPELPDLKLTARFSEKYKTLLAEIPERVADNDRLLALIYQNTGRAARHHYTLEVLLSVAYLQRHHLLMLQSLAQIEETLSKASASAKTDPADALQSLTDAHKACGQVLAELQQTFTQLRTVWEKSQLPRNASTAEKKFLHVMDDVKDHFADRRVDLSYMIAPEQSIGLEQWRKDLGEIIKQFAAANGQPQSAFADYLIMDD
jgi:hexosaminidase